MARWGIRGDCKFGTYHDVTVLRDTPRYKVEKCVRCNKRFKWGKWNRGRVDNVNYLKVHVRSFCQENGPTKRVFKKIYRKEECRIIVN